MSPRTLFEKVWDAHLVESPGDGRPVILYIDLHLLHEVTSPQAFAVLRERGMGVRHPQRIVATLDHSTPTQAPNADGSRPYLDDATRAQVEQLETNCREFGVALHGWDSAERGIVHVMAPELGRTQPGMTIVCGDSHTSTHGAFGALAFGIGTTEVSHVLATQCLLQRRPKTMAVNIEGALQTGVTAKDLTLHVIGLLGVDGGIGHVIEFRGSTVRGLSMDERMTLCNMSIEMGARAGMIAADATTVNWLRGRPQAPQSATFERAAQHWLTLTSDPGAQFDREMDIDATRVVPTITWGTDPGRTTAIDALLPMAHDAATRNADAYMRLREGQTMVGETIDMVFIGSCTNGRLSDLRAAAEILRGQQVHPRVRMLVVPGSERVKRDAEAEGLDRVFRAAGAQWREPGCSMCIGMNGDIAKPGELVVSTSNRNFEGRQGKGVRTVLASPPTAAACAIAGAIVDPRKLRTEAA